MIDEKAIKFGYGDISVGSNGISGTITFQQFTPVCECGEDTPDNVELIGKKVVISINLKNYKELETNLKRVLSAEIRVFEFEGFIFDFTNYNSKSVEVCLAHMNRVLSFLCLTKAA